MAICQSREPFVIVQLDSVWGIILTISQAPKPYAMPSCPSHHSWLAVPTNAGPVAAKQ